MRLPREELRRRALDALHIEGGIRNNHCDSVSNEFLCRLEDVLDTNLSAATHAPFKGRKHFVATVPAEYCAFGGDNGEVIVDATVKQFDDVVDEDLPDVAILPPGDTRREEWYDFED